MLVFKLVRCFCRPDVIDFVSAMSEEDGLSSALKVAEEALGVPKIIEAKGYLDHVLREHRKYIFPNYITRKSMLVKLLRL